MSRAPQQHMSSQSSSKLHGRLIQYPCARQRYLERMQTPHLLITILMQLTSSNLGGSGKDHSRSFIWAARLESADTEWAGLRRPKRWQLVQHVEKREQQRLHCALLRRALLCMPNAVTTCASRTLPRHQMLPAEYALHTQCSCAFALSLCCIFTQGSSVTLVCTSSLHEVLDWHRSHRRYCKWKSIQAAPNLSESRSYITHSLTDGQALEAAKKAVQGWEAGSTSTRRAALESAKIAAEHSQLCHKFIRAVNKS